MRQRFLLLLLAATLFSMSFAVTSTLAVSESAVSIEKKDAYSGDEISIGGGVANNPGIWGMDLRISFDKNAMTLVSVENGGFYQNSEWTEGNLSADMYTLSYEADGLENILTTSGTLAILNFKINENAIPGTYEIKAAYNDGDIINASFDEIEFNIFNGSVTVNDSKSTYTPGDLNGDDKINLVDVVLLIRYQAGWENLEIVKEAADFDGDGSVGMKDIILLLRSLA